MAELTQSEITAIQKRAEIKTLAAERGRAFTNLEVVRFLGGGTGIRALRSGTAKVRAGAISPTRQIISPKELEIKTSQARVDFGRKIEIEKGRAIIALRDIFKKNIRKLLNRTEKLRENERLKRAIDFVTSKVRTEKSNLLKQDLKTIEEKTAGIRDLFKESKIVTRFKTKTETLEAIRIARRPAVKRKLPFGLEAVVRGERDIVTGEKFSPFAPINFFARKGAESQKVRAIAKTFAKELPVVGQLATLAASSKDPTRVLSFISIAQLGILFDPAIRTGGTQQQRAIRKKLSENRFKDLDIDDVLNDLQRKQKGKVIKDKTLGEKVEDARKIFNKIRETKNAKLRAKQIEEFKLLMKTAHGEAGANQVLTELISQEGALGIQKAVVGRVLSPRVRPQIKVVADVIPDIKGVGLVPSTLQSPRERLRVKTAQATAQRESQRSKLTLGQKFEQAQRSTTAQTIAQAQKSAQAQRTAQRLRTFQALSPLLKSATSGFKITKLGIRTPFLKPVKPFLLLKRNGKKKKKVKKKIPTGKLGYNVKIRSKGKLKRLNVVPLTKSRARDLGSFIADKSTARTFFISRTAKRAQKPKLKVPSSYFARNKRKFRGPKKKGRVQPIKNKAIEKRRFAIDSRGEIKGLSAARLRSRLFKEFKKRKRK